MSVIQLTALVKGYSNRMLMVVASLITRNLICQHMDTLKILHMSALMGISEFLVHIMLMTSFQIVRMQLTNWNIKKFLTKSILHLIVMMECFRVYLDIQGVIHLDKYVFMIWMSLEIS